MVREGQSRRKGYMYHIYNYMYIYIIMTDLCCCTAETSKTLYSNYPPMKNFLRKWRKKKQKSSIKETIEKKTMRYSNSSTHDLLHTWLKTQETVLFFQHKNIIYLHWVVTRSICTVTSKCTSIPKTLENDFRKL